MGITYKDIEKVNQEIVYTPIERYDKKKGETVKKNYAEVAQKITAFRKLYPQGFIIPKIVSHQDGVIVMTASCGFYADDGRQVVLGVGTAFEAANSNQINKTSYIENCETSAVGRALAFTGLGGADAVASVDELENALLTQAQEREQWDKTKEIRLQDQKNLYGLISKINEYDRGFWADVCQMFGVEKVSQIKNEDFVVITELARNKLHELGVDEMTLGE